MIHLERVGLESCLVSLVVSLDVVSVRQPHLQSVSLLLRRVSLVELDLPHLEAQVGLSFLGLERVEG